MSIPPEDDKPARVDCMALAREAFQGCRHGFADTGKLLDMLPRAIEQLRQSGSPIVELPGSWLRSIDPYFQGAIQGDTDVDEDQDSPRPPIDHELVSFIELSARELRRLWSSGAMAAVASLGYALHPVPGLVQSGQAVDPELFQFNFRVAAWVWRDLSPEMQQALCDVAGFDREKVEHMVSQSGFAVDVFGSARPR